MLSPATTQPERILTIGSFGCGKTYNLLKVAHWLASTDTPGTVYVIDSDESYGRMLAEPASPFFGLPNIVVREVFDWDEYTSAIDEFRPGLLPGDWLGVDFVGRAWRAVQDWYIRRIHGTDPADFFMRARESMKSGSPLDGWKDWMFINREYQSWIDKVLKRNPSHIYLTATVESVRETDDAATRATFGRLGVRPQGQKELPFQVHTVLLQQVVGKEWFLTSVKDRERALHTGTKLDDFVVQYLMGTAGWTVA